MDNSPNNSRLIRSHDAWLSRMFSISVFLQIFLYIIYLYISTVFDMLVVVIITNRGEWFFLGWWWGGWRAEMDGFGWEDGYLYHKRCSYHHEPARVYDAYKFLFNAPIAWFAVWDWNASPMCRGEKKTKQNKTKQRQWDKMVDAFQSIRLSEKIEAVDDDCWLLTFFEWLMIAWWH